MFSSTDGELALNMFNFDSSKTINKIATENDMKNINNYLSSVNYDLRDTLSIDEYRLRISPAYAVTT